MGTRTSIKRLRSPFGYPSEGSPIVVTYLLNGHQALDTLLSLALFQEYNGGKYSPGLEGDDRL